MKQTLGKTINRLFLLLFLTLGASADVSVSVNNPAIYKGEMVNYTITADSANVEFPDLAEIAGFPVLGSSSSQSIRMINNNTTRSIAKTYTFKPERSVTIPSYEVTVDGDTFQTKEIDVKVVKPSASQNGQPFVLTMQVDKNSSYVGEAIDLSITFKRKLNRRVQQVELSRPKLENFWVKEIEGADKKRDGDYIVETIHYKLFPQKSGSYTIPSLTATVGEQTKQQRRGGFFDDPFFGGQQLRWQKVYSNASKIEVKALPNGLEVYGNYAITATVDSKKVHANKPVNLTINIKGEGNIDDIKKFDLTLPNVITYADEPKISSEIVHNIYEGEFNQKIALIGDQNFTIPSLELAYFDKNSKKVKHLTTEPIEIEVIGGTTNNTLTKPATIEVSPAQQIHATPTAEVKTEIKVVKEDAYVKYLFLLIGFLLGLALAFALNHFKNRTVTPENNMVKAIKKAKDDKALFNLLLPHANHHKEVAEALNKLEKNIYKSGSETIDREILMEVFE